jgi:hypothetical protein
MTDEKHTRDEPDEAEDGADATLLPGREVMSLIAPGGGGMGGIIPAIGAEPGFPTGAPAPGGLADGAASHATDAAAGQQPDHPVSSDQPQSLSPSSDKTASSST